MMNVELHEVPASSVTIGSLVFEIDETPEAPIEVPENVEVQAVSVGGLLFEVATEPQEPGTVLFGLFEI